MWRASSHWWGLARHSFYRRRSSVGTLKREHFRRNFAHQPVLTHELVAQNGYTGRGPDDLVRKDEFVRRDGSASLLSNSSLLSNPSLSCPICR